MSNEQRRPISSSTSTESMVRLIYGCDDVLPIVPPEIPVPQLKKKISPGQKSVASTSDARCLTIPRPRFYSGSIPRAAAKGKEQYRKSLSVLTTRYVPSDRQKEYQQEPYLYFYHSSHVVQEILSEIESLPFTSALSLGECYESFLDEVSRVVRQMKVDGYLEMQTESNNDTAIFALNVNAARKKVIPAFLQTKEISFNNMTQKQKIEFSCFNPSSPMSDAKSGEYEDHIFSSIVERIDCLPPSYRFTNTFETPKKQNLHSTSKVDSLARMVGNAQFPAKRRSRFLSNADESHLPPLTPIPYDALKQGEHPDINAFGMQWDTTESLTNGSRRQPYMMLKEYTKPFNIDSVNFSDIDPCVPDYLLVKEENKEDVPKVATFRTANKEHDEILEINSPHNHGDDLNFLNERTTDIILSGVGDSMFRRLETIWEQLGFTTIQKLTMAAKYSGNIELSQKLSESLPLWEGAEKAASLFTSSYRILKSFLKFEKIDQKKLEYHVLYTTFQKNCETVLMYASKLLAINRDDLIISRRKATDLVALRRARIVQIRDEMQL